EEIGDPLGLRTLKGNLGQAVLRDLDGTARCTHLRTKIVHLCNGDAGVAGHDNRTGSLEDFVQLRDEFAFFRSFHCLSPVDRTVTSHGDLPGLPLPPGIPLQRSRATLEDPVPPRSAQKAAAQAR